MELLCFRRKDFQQTSAGQQVHADRGTHAAGHWSAAGASVQGGRPRVSYPPETLLQGAVFIPCLWRSVYNIIFSVTLKYSLSVRYSLSVTLCQWLLITHYQLLIVSY